jgi:hypothetical protein
MTPQIQIHGKTTIRTETYGIRFNRVFSSSSLSCSVVISTKANVWRLLVRTLGLYAHEQIYLLFVCSSVQNVAFTLPTCYLFWPFWDCRLHLWSPFRRHHSRLYFSSFQERAMNLLILLSLTTNFPDIMMPAYTKVRWHNLFFNLLSH